ncbi:MAG: aminotransferase class V-fold PLP-dependent enzyme [Anaerolineales bacterium]|nr:aminotransferase class V-fold PLP-dependent enzyme [Anaerolineales bacterium]MCW5856556.1 aminotransferase class V-fold PLP-dependent enzyme [Anaerolineales bacterium]
MKHMFFNDYSEGAHPRILQRLGTTNLQQMTGYGEDEVSLEAQKRIQNAIGSSDAAVHFVSGGTQANLLCLASMLKPYESVIAPVTGHINVHEAGAVEATGHRIEAIPTPDGKLRPDRLEPLIVRHADEHMTKPKVVFLSHSTEVGTIYSKQELEALSRFCHSHGLYLYLDGARLGSALTAPQADLTLGHIAQLTDMFYIGGTKNGALLGEAIVINNPALQPEFRRHIKQRGGLLAKGRSIGVQFLELFSDELYFDLARHANQMAHQLAAGIQALGFSFLTPPASNQIFPILPDALIKRVQADYGFYLWEPQADGHSAVRLVTSWATPEKAVDQFLVDLKQLA